MKLRKVILTSKELFDGRLVFAAEPGKGIRKLLVGAKSVHKVEYTTLRYGNCADLFFPKVQNKRQQLLTGTEALTYIKKIDPNFSNDSLDTFWLIVEKHIAVEPSILLVEAKYVSNTLGAPLPYAYNWPLSLIRGVDSSLRLFAKEKQAIRYSKLLEDKELESLFDFIDDTHSQFHDILQNLG